MGIRTVEVERQETDRGHSDCGLVIREDGKYAPGRAGFEQERHILTRLASRRLSRPSLGQTDHTLSFKGSGSAESIGLF